MSRTTMNVPTRHTPIATQRYETRPTDPSPLGAGVYLHGPSKLARLVR